MPARTRGCRRSPTIRASASRRSAGAPGVQSARYAGEPKSDARNNQKLVAALQGVADRRAHYYCVLVLVRHADDPEPLIAEGIWHGTIVDTPRGAGGFGYDPHFLDADSGLTGAELPLRRRTSCRIAARRCARCSRGWRGARGGSCRRAFAGGDRRPRGQRRGAALAALPPLALYVHVPWCVRKCPYCDFNSHEARGDVPEDAYVDALLADLESALPLVWGRKVTTVFLGGGTPSLFSAAAIDRLLAGVRARLPLLPDAEVTLEANPGTFERQKFAGFFAAGVNRLSLGVQSFEPGTLRALGRVHDADEARRAAEAALMIFGNVNLDLMYALPRQTVAQARADLAAALAFSPPHLSFYHLTLEPNTLFHRHPPPLPDEDTAADIEDAVHETLERRRLSPLRDVGLRETRPDVRAQRQLLALRRLPGDRRGRALEAVASRTASCGSRAGSSRSSTWSRWRRAAGEGGDPGVA